jgi:ABC-type uncharacterized transport system involved in gliding motility auxiliary subunit
VVVMQFISKWSWVFAVVGAFFGAIAVALYGFFGELGTPGTLLLVAGGSLFIAWAAFDKDNVKAGLSTKQFRYGSGSVLVTALAVMLAVGTYVVTTRHDASWDWSRAGRFTLSEMSVQTAQSLQEEVRVMAFFPENSLDDQMFRLLMESYQAETDQLLVQFVDPDAYPTLAADNAVNNAYGTVILQAGNRSQRIESDFSEESFTNTLIRLFSAEDHRLCWSTGHLEIDPDDDQSPGGLGFAVLKLEGRNYTVTKSAILTEGIDPSCDAVIVAAPQRDWEVAEREALAEYIAGGGRALLMIEPRSVPELSADIERYGVVLGDDLVQDPEVRGQAVDIADKAFVIVLPEEMALHPITEQLNGPVLLGASRTVSAVRGVQGYVLHELMIGSDESWGETNFERNPLEDPLAWQPNLDTERVGNVPLMVASTITDPLVLGTASPDVAQGLVAGGAVVVAGTADFARNDLYVRGANQDLFENIIGWLVDDETPLAPGPSGDGDELYLDLVRLVIAALTSVVILPGLAVLLAMIVLVRRRFQ